MGQKLFSGLKNPEWNEILVKMIKDEKKNHLRLKLYEMPKEK